VTSAYFNILCVFFVFFFITYEIKVLFNDADNVELCVYSAGRGPASLSLGLDVLLGPKQTWDQIMDEHGSHRYHLCSFECV